MKDIDEIRRDNLRRIEADAGGLSEAAKLVGMSPAQFANLREGAKDSKTGKRRGMRKDTARRIEQAAGKPTGWLDTDFDSAEWKAFEARILNAPPAQLGKTAAILWRAYRASSPATRAAIDLLLLSPQQRAGLKSQHPLAAHGIELLEAHAREALNARKIA